MEQKFYICRHCKTLVAVIKEVGHPTCCNEAMEELVPNTVDASKEKHLPVISINNSAVTVTVGSVLHPMSEEHHIEWVILQTSKGRQRKVLSPYSEPVVTFLIEEDEKVEAALAYCNLHGLWKTTL